MVKVGEVEFLVKFDGINTEFKKTLVSALKEAGVSGGGGRGGGDTDEQIREINLRLRRMFVTTGKFDSYRQFLTKSENIVENLTDEKRIQEIAENALTSPATRKFFGISDEDMKEYQSEALPKAIEKITDISTNMLDLVQKSVLSEKEWEKRKAMFGTVLPMFESVQGGNRIKDIISYMIRRTMDEAINVTSFLTDIAKGRTMNFQARKLAGGEEEKRWDLVWGEFGEGGTDITDPQEFMNAFMDKAAGRLSNEQLADIFLYGKKPAGEIVDVVEDIAQDIIDEFTIRQETAIPHVISDIFEKLAKESDSDLKVFAKSREELNEMLGRTALKSEKIWTKMDFIVQGSIKELKEYAQDFEDLTGVGGLFDTAIEKINEYSFEEKGFAIIESKLTESIANFKWDIPIVKGIGDAIAKGVFSGALNIPEVDKDNY